MSFLARRSPLFSLALVLGLAGACGGTSDSPLDELTGDLDAVRGHNGEVTLTLETRSGTSEQGWSIARDALVPAEEADLTISSLDCGARGRWVYLEANGLDLCPSVLGVFDEDACSWNSSIEVGGSQPEANLGDAFFAVRDGHVVARIVLVDRTDTPFEWYETPDAPFHVVLTVDPVDQRVDDESAQRL